MSRGELEPCSSFINMFTTVTRYIVKVIIISLDRTKKAQAKHPDVRYFVSESRGQKESSERRNLINGCCCLLNSGQRKKKERKREREPLKWRALCQFSSTQLILFSCSFSKTNGCRGFGIENRREGEPEPHKLSIISEE